MEKGRSYSILPPKSDKNHKGHTRNINFFPFCYRSSEENCSKIMMKQENQHNKQRHMSSSFDFKPLPSPTFVQSNCERRAKSGTTNSSINHYSRNAYPYSSHQRYNEDNENSIFTGYVSMTEFLKQYKETNERISRLESLVWKMLNNSLPQLYDELDAKIKNSNRINLKMLEEQRLTVMNVFSNLSDEIQNFKSSLTETQESTRKSERLSSKEKLHLSELQEVIEEDSNISESEMMCKPDFSSVQNSDKKSSPMKITSSSPISNKDSYQNELDSIENPEFYFSCHEKFITNKQDSEEPCSSMNPSVSDPRETNTMPNLSQSSLMDQIDYELDGLKINEYSSELREINDEEIGSMRQYQLNTQSSNK